MENNELIQYALIAGLTLVSFSALLLSARPYRELEIAKNVVKIIKDLTLNYPKDK